MDKKKFIDLNQFQLLNSIGSGSFSEVFRVKDINTGYFYAAKKIKYEITENTMDQQEFLLPFREVKLISSLNHPSILRFMGFSPFDFDGKPFPIIITQYESNGTLRDIINLQSTGLSPKKWDDTKKLINIYGIAAGLQYLHHHDIIHRDMKPENILLDENLFPKIADFGFSKITSSVSKSLNVQSQNHFKGTPIYMAPEILKDEPYSKSVDVYAFSIIVYEILTAKTPFQNLTIPQIMMKVVFLNEKPKLTIEIPHCYSNLIIKCWSQNPEERPNFDQIVNELKNNNEFIIDTINKDDFYDYIDYIDEYKSTFNINNTLHFDEFVNSRKVQDIEINNSQQLIHNDKNQNIQEVSIVNNENYSKLTKEYDNLSAVLEEENKICQEVNKKVAEFNLKIDDKVKYLNKLAETILFLKAEKKGLSDEVSELLNDVSNLNLLKMINEIEIKKVREQLEDLKNKIEPTEMKNSEQMNQLNQKISIFDSNSSKINEMFTKMRNEKSQLKSDLQRNKSECEHIKLELEEKINELISMLEEIKSTSIKFEDQITSMKVDSDTKVETFKNLAKNYDVTLKDDIGISFESFIDNLNKYLNQSKKALSESLGNVEQLSIELEKDKKDLFNVEFELEKTTKDIEKIESKLEKSTNDLGKIESDLEELKKSLNDIQSELENSEEIMIKTQQELELTKKSLVQVEHELEITNSQYNYMIESVNNLINMSKNVKPIRLYSIDDIPQVDTDRIYTQEEIDELLKDV